MVPLEAYLPELGLGPEVLEVAVPTCFRDDRAEVCVGGGRRRWDCALASGPARRSRSAAALGAAAASKTPHCVSRRTRQCC